MCFQGLQALKTHTARRQPSRPRAPGYSPLRRVSPESTGRAGEQAGVLGKGGPSECLSLHREELGVIRIGMKCPNRCPSFVTSHPFDEEVVKPLCNDKLEILHKLEIPKSRSWGSRHHLPGWLLEENSRVSRTLYVLLSCSASSAQPPDTLAWATGSGCPPGHGDVCAHDAAGLLARDADTVKRSRQRSPRKSPDLPDTGKFQRGSHQKEILELLRSHNFSAY